MNQDKDKVRSTLWEGLKTLSFSAFLGAIIFYLLLSFARLLLLLKGIL